MGTAPEFLQASLTRQHPIVAQIKVSQRWALHQHSCETVFPLHGPSYCSPSMTDDPIASCLLITQRGSSSMVMRHRVVIAVS